MTDPTYRERIERKRAADDADLRAPGSPLLPADRATFTGLPYFPVDEAWRITGLTLEPYDGDAPSSFGMDDTTSPSMASKSSGM